MTSIKHQFMVDCIIRKMRLLGFEPCCLDGKSTLISFINLPKRVIRHRPDVIGINKGNKLCIGEAKTKTDIFSCRTKEQIVDYASAGFYTLFACPKSGYSQLNGLVQRLCQNNKRNTSILKIPDELIPNEEV